MSSKKKLYTTSLKGTSEDILQYKIYQNKFADVAMDGSSGLSHESGRMSSSDD